MAKATDVRPQSLARIKTEAQAKKFIEKQIEEIKKQVGDGKVLLALSGGVDSSVCAALIAKAIGKNLTCVHVNHGLLRKGEPEMVCKVFSKQFKTNLVYVDATNKFLNALKGVSDPEEKRKIIGKIFIDVFAKEAKKLKGVEFLGQGTIYPDILESKVGIKAHHNVGGLPKDMQKFALVEPVKFLYKDEVRVVGKALGLPENMVNRQPFPGPGLGVRCVGAITRDRLEAVRESDAILRDEFKKAGLEGKVWQYFTIVPDFKTTGMENGKRTYKWPVVIRAINSVDATAAQPVELSYKLIQKITKRILKEVPSVSRVLVDYSFKDPKLNSATIEWE
ncbi:MAG: glutamine-hydrolyzing GMP synthase [Clostridia bacterium]|nr:glutamine-hydrolyzing GMP synthase [Clostridia bacterium]